MPISSQNLLPHSGYDSDVPRILALDIGTSSVRATVYGSNLRPLKDPSQVRYSWHISADGSAELPASQLERLVAEAVDGALTGVRGRIDVVAAAAFWHSLLGADRSGRAVTPVLPWNDVRAAAQATALSKSYDEAAVHARTGCRFHPAYWPARLRWFRECDPRTFVRVDRWMSFPAYLQQRWLGSDAESHSQASGTGLYAHEKGTWDAALCQTCGVAPRQLGSIVDVDGPAGELRASHAQRWPALKGARWIPAAGDGALNNLGAGCVDGTSAALMIGTSGALRLAWPVNEEPAVPPALWRYRLDRRRVVIGGALSNGGNFIGWMRDTFGMAIDSRLDARLARLPPDGHGLTMLPFLAGERSPDYRPHARAVFAGLHTATTREEILKAGLEAIAYRFLAVFQELIAVRAIKRIVATGTALQSSPVWVQTVADVLGQPVIVPREAELTSRGAAVLGLEQLGLATGASPGTARAFQPDHRAHTTYRAAAERQRALLTALTGKFL